MRQKYSKKGGNYIFINQTSINQHKYTLGVISILKSQDYVTEIEKRGGVTITSHIPIMTDEERNKKWFEMCRLFERLYYEQERKKVDI